MFDNSYRKMGDAFFTELEPARVPQPELIRVNESLAEELGIDMDSLTADIVVGNALLPGSEPIATVYAGHQFGSFNPQLGDGRAILLGEVVTDEGKRFDVQLKGSGRTPYSRRGDGKSPLGPVLREYIVSEAMHALGVPTTRSLAAATTGEPVYREVALPGAVLVRVASSHLRVGTLEYFASQGDLENLAMLVEYVLQRHYPDSEHDSPPVALLTAVIERQAKLVAQWQLLGFIHGVMNTDNVLLCGETIDYGPCAFMDTFEDDKVFSSIDRHGRYAYNNQPHIMHWNMGALARALVPLTGGDEEVLTQMQTALDSFPQRFQDAYFAGFAEKLGLSEVSLELVEGLLNAMQSNEMDYTQTFHALTQSLRGGEFPAPLEAWSEKWHAAMAADSALPADQKAKMTAVNPAIIPRNHQIEAAIEEANRGDFDRFHRLVEALRKPGIEHGEFAQPPGSDEVVAMTFCGT